MVTPEGRIKSEFTAPAWLVRRANEDKAKLEPGGLARTLQEIVQKAPKSANSELPMVEEQEHINYTDPFSHDKAQARTLSPPRSLFIPENRSAIPQSPTDIPSPESVVQVQKDRYSVRPLPKWYTSIKDTSFEMKELKKRRPQALASLESLKACIIQCEVSKKTERTKVFEDLRDHVHKAEITLHVNKYIVKQSRILATETGLPRIFRQAHAKFPSDLRADAYQLYNRWYDENFEQDILRGIITVKGKDRNGDQLCKAYKANYPTTAKAYGENGLVLGQWWPTQLCTVRDGAHGSSQGGIFGEKGKGAYSIVLSGGSGYHDIDNGDTIEYSGTEGKNCTPTENTQHLILSAELGNVIRIIRSAQLNKKNAYRPELGLRYDGLYTVKGYKLVDKEKAMYRFHLERCVGQGPIRYKDNAARRPTVFEVREFNRLRDKVW